MAVRTRSWIAMASSAALATALLAAPSHAEAPAEDDGLAANAAPTDGRADGEGVDADFDPIFFSRGGSSLVVDVSRFARGNPVPAGRYLVDLRVNGDWVTRTEIQFRAEGDNPATATPCLDEATLDKIGVDLGKLAPEVVSRFKAGSGACVALTDAVPGAAVAFDSGEQALDISIPQIALRNNPRGYVDPRYWSEGTRAARLGYDFNLFHTEGRARTTLGYLGLRGGINLGAWRFRHDGSLSFGSGRTRYNGIRTYAQRDITALRSQLVIGDSFTDGQLFDSIGFRGISLATDDRMLPESQRGYAPVVRGTARTNATVVIHQNGNLIYQATVAPGAFEITDLYATGYGGDLVVTVNEADGRSETFTVPFASIPQLLRQGTSRFSVTAGEVRNGFGGARPFLFQATAQRGLTNLLTGYAGTTIAGRYRSALAGVALNTSLGAFGADVTVADAGLSGIASKGMSFRLSYARLIASTGTSFSLAAYRYSSKGFWSLQDTLAARAPDRSFDLRSIDRQRNSFQLNVSQSLGPRWGSFYLTASTRQYWNRDGSDTFYQAGYSNRLGPVGYSLSASRQTDRLTGRPDNRFMLSLNFVAGRGEGAPNVSTTLAASSRGPFQAQASISGTTGEERELSWNASFAHQGEDNSAAGNLQYRSRLADLSAGVGIGRGYQQGSVGASGTILFHAGGVTFGQPSGDAIGILHAPGAGGARVSSTPGVRLDGNGYAILPYLTPYVRNPVEIDPKGIPLDVELEETSQNVTPRAGAVVPVKFGSVTGRAAVIAVRTSDGAAIPFGAAVLSPTGEEIGQAGQGGRIFVRGVADSGALLVRWGEGASEQCRLDYRLPARPGGAATAYDHIDAICRPAGAAGPAIAANGE